MFAATNLWHGEAGEEALKEGAGVQGGQAPAKLTLGRARRPNEENVLACQCCQQQQANLRGVYRSNAFLRALKRS